MTPLQTPYPGLSFTEPNPDRDAPLTLEWFTSPYGRETLLLMGNAEHEIETPSLESERQTLQEFVDLKNSNQQLTWMLRIDDKTVGVAWIELTKNHNVQPPSVHLMIGAKDYRGKGIGKATMIALVDYIHAHMHADAIYSRHLKSNIAVSSMNQSLGFINDGAPYNDENGLEWQNIKLTL